MKRYRINRNIGVLAAGAAAVLALPFALAAPAAAAPAAAGTAAYRVIDLGTLPGADDSIASGINNRGDVVGQSGGRPVLWRQGRIVELGPAAGPYGTAEAVNNRGVVVGYWGQGADRFQAFRWQDGRMTLLRPLAGDSSTFATAVNDRGEILGLSTGEGYRPVLWRPDGTVVDLTATTGLLRVNDLNNSGRLAGAVSPDGMNTVPALWSRGRITVLDDTPGVASAINDRGEVAGFHFVGQAGSFTWWKGRVTEIPLLPDMPPASAMQAQAINNRGQVVGFGGFDGFMWDGRTLTVLPELYGNGPAAFDINDRGEIVGSVGTTPENLQPHAVLLVPRH